MDDMEKDPEEIPMDQVLAEIRQMLTAQNMPKENTPLPDSNRVEPTLTPEEPTITPAPKPVTAPISPVSEKPKTVPDYFLLTPAMRCDLPSDSELSETVQKQTTRVLNKLQQQSNTELSPALIDWLNANLPGMIEKALANHSKLGG